MKTVYQLDSKGFLVGEALADPDPRRPGEFLLPGGCVEAVPPSVKAAEVARWVNGDWAIVPDLRGTVYWLPNGSEHRITEAGLPLPEGAVTTAPAPTLQVAQEKKLIELAAAFDKARQASVQFTTAAGVTQTFQADTRSQEFLAKASQGYQQAGAVPAGFYWVSYDGTQVPFALTDLAGLYAVMLAQGWAAFQNLQMKKGVVLAPGATVASVQAVTW